MEKNGKEKKDVIEEPYVSSGHLKIAVVLEKGTTAERRR